MNYTLNSRVDIEVGLSRPVSRREMLPRICVVGVVPMNAPIIAEQSPYALIRKSDYALDFLHGTGSEVKILQSRSQNAQKSKIQKNKKIAERLAKTKIL